MASPSSSRMVLILDVFLIISSIALIFFILGAIFGFFEWKWSKDKIAPTITFSAFINFYNLTPEKWELRYDKVDYLREGHNTSFIRKEPITIEFKTFFDVLQYRKWIKNINKQKRQEIQIEITKEFITSLQKNINKYDEEWSEWVKKECNNGTYQQTSNNK